MGVEARPATTNASQALLGLQMRQRSGRISQANVNAQAGLRARRCRWCGWTVAVSNALSVGVYAGDLSSKAVFGGADCLSRDFPGDEPGGREDKRHGGVLAGNTCTGTAILEWRSERFCSVCIN